MNRSRSWIAVAALIGLGSFGWTPKASGQCEQTIAASDGAAGDRFGEAMDFDGATVIIGSRFDDFPGRLDAGSAYLFTGSGLDWSQAVKLVAPDGAAGDQLGGAVSIHGSYAAVGAGNAASPLASFSGAVYLWHRAGDGTWSYLTKITAPDAASGDRFGKSVALYNGFLLVGAPQDDNANGANAGAIYIFRNTSGTTWTFLEKIIAGDGHFNDGFGWSVAMTDYRIAASAYYASTNGHFNNGAVYTFQRDNTGSPFILDAKLSASDAYDTAGFGNVVDLASDRLFVTDQLAPVGGHPLSGKVYMFSREANSWSESGIGELVSPSSNVYLGSTMASNGARVAMGGIGLAVVFEITGNSLVQQWVLADPSDTPDDRFGSAVAIANNTLFVGDKDESPAGADFVGNAHVFQLNEQGADTCEGAAPLYPSTAAIACLLGNTPGNMTGICGASAVTPDVFYTFRPACSGSFTFSTAGSDFDTVISVHSACPATAANAVGCDDDGGPLHTSLLTVNLVANTRYFIRVSGYNGAVGMYRLLMTESYPTPINDTCLFATGIGAGSYSVSTCGATTDPGVYSACSSGARDIWYRVTAPCAGIMTVDLCQANYDSTIDIFPSSCMSIGNAPIACNDDFCGYQSQVRFAATSGTQYLVRIGGWIGDTGSGTLNVSCNACPCNWNQDAFLNSQDFFDFLSAFFSGAADYNLDGPTNSQDFFDFVSCFFTGC